MSCISPSFLKKSKLHAVEIEAIVQARGGQTVERRGRAALAIMAVSRVVM
jgi:hypothetical protein